MKSSPYAAWTHKKVSPQNRTFSNESIHIEGKIQTPTTSTGCTLKLPTFTVVADGLKSLIGRNLFYYLGLAVTQSSSSQANQFNNISSLSEFKKHIVQNFPSLISRIRKSKNHVAKSNFQEDFQPRHQKGERIADNLQDKVNKKLQTLLDEKHIIKLFSCSEKNFISPIVVIVSKHETRVNCDASRSAIGAAIEQLTVDVWKPIAFTSRFLHSCEGRYSVNELEFLGEV